MPGQNFHLFIVGKSWLEPRGSLAAAASLDLGGVSKRALAAVAPLWAARNPLSSSLVVAALQPVAPG
jgi:hypothetical protein